MIPPDILFLGLAGIAFLGFIIDSLFYRLRITSVLPLMLIGVLLVLTGVIPAGTIGLLNSFIPYVSAITVAFILFHVGLEIRFSDLFRVLGRATAFTIGVQSASGVLISLLAYATLHWGLLLSFVFGFALSGPSSIAVPTLVRLTKMPDGLRTTLLFESVFSDVLQLLVPLVLLGFYVSGTVSPLAISSTLLWTVLGSAAGGIAAAVVWLALLDRLKRFAAGYTWTLTITMVLATYGAADRLGMSPAIAIFVFGLTLGNSTLLDFRQSSESRVPGGWLRYHLHELRHRLGLSTRGLDIPHILQVQKEVSFFAASFFFVYIGLLFQAGDLTPLLVAVAVGASFLMLGLRFAFTPILAPNFDSEPSARKLQRGLVSFNISRGLAAAVVATVPRGYGLVIPGFLDGIFLAILLSTVLSTVGIFYLYRPARPGGPPLAEEEFTELDYLALLHGPEPTQAPSAPIHPEPSPPEPGAPTLPAPPLPDPGRRRGSPSPPRIPLEPPR